MRYILTPNPNPPYNLRTIQPAYGGVEFVDWTEEQVLDHVIKRNHKTGLIAPGNPYYIVDADDLPDYWFFDAWEWDGEGVTVNLEKARTVQENQIRAACADQEVEYPEGFNLSRGITSAAQLKERWPDNLDKRV